jgi:hypothetical protein
MNAIISGQHELSDEYAALSDDEKIGFIRDVVSQGRQRAKAILLAESSELRGMVDQARDKRFGEPQEDRPPGVEEEAPSMLAPSSFEEGEEDEEPVMP